MNEQPVWPQVVLESLEPRLLLDAALVHGLWRIWGRDNPADPADHIVLRHSPDDPAVLQALVNGEVIDSRAVADVRAIKVFAGLGDDVVRVELDEAIPAWVIGGPGDDDITGAGGGDVLRGGRGADRLTGGDGDDRLIGGRGNDVLFGGAGDDRLRGGWGRDSLRGQGGADRLFGGRGRNWLYCLPSIDRLHRRPGDVMIIDADLSIPGDDQLGLAPADSTDELMQWLIEAAVEANRDLFGKPLQGPGGWMFPRPVGGGFVGFRGDLAVFQAGLADQAAPDHSQTNVQEAGVDEADLVKTDGNYIYLLHGRELVIVDSWPADELSVVSRTELEGTPLSMFLYGERLAVLSCTWTTWDLWDQQGRALAADGAMGPLGGPSLGLPVYCKPKLVFTVLDVSDRGAPEVLEQTSLDGTLVAARAIDGRVYLVVRDRGLDVWPMPVRDAQTGQWAYETEAQFRQRLAQELPDKLPEYATAGPGGQVVQGGSLLELPHVYVPGGVSHGPSLFVVNFDITDEQVGPDGSTSVVGLDGAVYASAESLYIVARQWSPPREWNGGPVSTIYKFELDGAEVPLVAKGAVPGTVLNQFSMDEEDGYFRIATLTRTDGVNASNIFILGQDGRSLEVAGSITGLALGERIRSVRFLDDKGFVVTFRRVDPLFALDLSDPFEPLLMGELKVPGFSSYLHPVEGDHLIGMGRDATLDGRVRGLKLSLFDVADLADPVQTDVYLLSAGRGWSFSPAERDHHAFSYFPADGVLAVPVHRMGPEGGWSVEVFEVDLEEGFTYLGGIAHEGPVRRSLRIGEYLYSISTDAVKVHQIDDPAAEVAQLELGSAGPWM